MALLAQYLNVRQRKLGTFILQAVQSVHILQHDSVNTGSLPKDNPSYFQITKPGSSTYRYTSVPMEQLYCFVIIGSCRNNLKAYYRLLREQIVSVVGSCSYNLLAYEAHPKKSKWRISGPKQNIFLLFFCVLFKSYKLGLYKKTRRSISHAWAPLKNLRNIKHKTEQKTIFNCYNGKQKSK